MNYELSPRQRDVADCLLRGLSLKETAKALDISLGSTKVHRQMLYARLGVKTDVQAVLKLMRQPVPLKVAV